MNRRRLIGTGAGAFGAFAFGVESRVGNAATATPDASAAPYPLLEIGIKDDGFEIPETIAAGRYSVISTNAGTQVSHSAMGRLPEGMTAAQLESLMMDNPAGAGGFTFNNIGLVGLPDWPAPGSTSSGVIDLTSGIYILFDPFGSRGIVRFTVSGEIGQPVDPAADLEVELVEMSIVFPAESMAAGEYRWKVSNTGAVWHEMAVLPVPESLTGDQLLTLFALPEGATPPAGLEPFEYNPVEAVGLIASGHSSWVDVSFAPGRYVAICMAPDETGMPHAMAGMFTFFTVE